MHHQLSFLLFTLLALYEQNHRLDFLFITLVASYNQNHLNPMVIEEKTCGQASWLRPLWLGRRIQPGWRIP